jgi:hypothetical protein
MLVRSPTTCKLFLHNRVLFFLCFLTVQSPPLPSSLQRTLFKRVQERLEEGGLDLTNLLALKQPHHIRWMSGLEALLIIWLELPALMEFMWELHHRDATALNLFNQYTSAKVRCENSACCRINGLCIAVACGSGPAQPGC